MAVFPIRTALSYAKQLGYTPKTTTTAPKTTTTAPRGTTGGFRGATVYDKYGYSSSGKPLIKSSEPVRSIAYADMPAYWMGKGRPDLAAQYTPELMAKYGGGGGGAATAAGGGGTTSEQSQLAQQIYEQNKAAEEKAETMYQEAKASLDAAYQAGLMSDTEYQDALTNARQTTEAQFDRLKREMTEGAYGQVNIGALRGGARELETARVGQIGAGEMAIRAERAGRRTAAESARTAGLQNLMQLRQIPRINIPEAFGAGAALTALRGAQPAPITQPTYQPKTGGIYSTRLGMFT